MTQPSLISRYNRGYRPRCKVCHRELEPCPIFDHAYPQKVRYCGFYPCPDHPHAGLIHSDVPS